jgi:hypothetical protein
VAHPPAGIAADKDDLQIMVGMAVGARLWEAKVLGWEEVKSRIAKTEHDQKENNGPELSQLINETKISDQKAKVAQENYNDLRKVAHTAVEKYIAKFK